MERQIKEQLTFDYNLLLIVYKGEANNISLTMRF